jgi:hypothetical protein
MLLDPKYDPDLEPQTYFLKLRPLHCAISARNRQCVLQLLQVKLIVQIHFRIAMHNCNMLVANRLVRTSRQLLALESVR